ncbi:hypothetical protein SKAU_G00339480 [Synaphobranchus kaupii]|uniref:Uncharacterized protein n=1 Tax=Synaphobranchus kaupii TaxID=118154 RepID=A0A9Q1IJ28_SYNKA|nr:hypothetical protein SKAU_G00339480 [Synaphobranchus kaupii]
MIKGVVVVSVDQTSKRPAPAQARRPGPPILLRSPLGRRVRQHMHTQLPRGQPSAQLACELVTRRTENSRVSKSADVSARFRQAHSAGLRCCFATRCKRRAWDTRDANERHQGRRRKVRVNRKPRQNISKLRRKAARLPASVIAFHVHGNRGGASARRLPWLPTVPTARRGVFALRFESQRKLRSLRETGTWAATKDGAGSGSPVASQRINAGPINAKKAFSPFFCARNREETMTLSKQSARVPREFPFLGNKSPVCRPGRNNEAFSSG